MFNQALEEIFTYENLEKSYNKLKNTSLGLDELSLKDIKEQSYLQNIKEQILSNSYTPEPLKEVKIPKNKSGSFRTLAIPSLKDKLVQLCLSYHLNLYFDKLFSNKSYAYRPDKSYKNAIFRARDFLKTYKITLKTDIKDFFDSLDHELLMQILNSHIKDKNIINLLEIWIKNGAFLKHTYDKQKIGVHQGDVLSPLLSNIYLDYMDKYLESKNIDFVRYADDFVVFFNQEKEANAFKNELEIFLESIKLKLNLEKTKICDKNSSFTFLGVYFTGENLSISEKKFQKVLNKLSSNIKISKNLNELVLNLNSYTIHLKSLNFKLFSESQTSKFENALKQNVSFWLKKQKLNPNEINESLKKLDFISYLSQTNKQNFIYDIKRLSKVTSIDQKLKSKQDEYLKKFSQKSFIHITTPYLFLGISKGKFVLKKEGKVYKSFLAKDLENIIINAPTSLSSAAIKEAVKKKISISFIDERTSLNYANLLNYDKTYTKTHLAQMQIYESKKAQAIAKEIIKAKVKNQLNFLKNSNKYHKNLEKQILNITKIANKTKFAKNKEELMGYEGASSANYWQGISQILDSKYEFQARATYKAKDLVNSSLNYAYALLYAEVTYAINQAGLSPSVSYLHSLNEQKPTLVYDLIEEFRTYVVDRLIISMLNKNEPFCIKDGFLSVKTRQNIVKNIQERLFSSSYYKGKNIRIKDIIASQAYLYKRAILEDVKYKAFIGRY